MSDCFRVANSSSSFNLMRGIWTSWNLLGSVLLIGFSMISHWGMRTSGNRSNCRRWLNGYLATCFPSPGKIVRKTPNKDTTIKSRGEVWIKSRGEVSIRLNREVLLLVSVLIKLKVRFRNQVRLKLLECKKLLLMASKPKHLVVKLQILENKPLVLTQVKSWSESRNC